MPGAFDIDVGRGLVLSRGWGVLTDDDLLAHVRALAADPRFKPHFSQLVDFVGITSVAVTQAGIAELASLNPYGVGSRRAVVVTSTVAYGLTRMYQIIRDEGRDEMEIFQDMDAAMKWLEIEEDKDVILAALAKAPEVKSLV